MENEKRLISADVAKEMIVNHANQFSDVLSRREKALLIGGGTACIDKCPTVDAVELAHGRWLLERTPDGKPYCFHCSVCDDDFGYIGISTAYRYCPNCGAKMDLPCITEQTQAAIEAIGRKAHGGEDDGK